ncbi:MAG TPA: YciI family protein [Steroidobacteraceae bacterium]|nr:YciI family protein [Steroidobacteraceae bacterium]
MSYMLLIREPRGQRAQRSEAEGRALYQRMLEFAGSLKARGLLLAAEALTREELQLRSAAGRPQLVDGPFTESKELIGGFFLVSCAQREEALALARECPALEWASIEVREVGTCYE